MGNQYDYDHYNREERYLCSHLFRLLHEPKDNHFALREFTGVDSITPGKFRIYAEVALIRDAYHAMKGKDHADFIAKLIDHIAMQQKCTEYTKYHDLHEDLRDAKKTHPRQLHEKIHIQDDNKLNVYKTLSEYFSAKPDLMICLPDRLLVYEAKYSLGFDDKQLQRTENIAKVWNDLLHEHLGIANPVEQENLKTLKLELEKFRPDTSLEKNRDYRSWQEVYEIAKQVYPEGDRTREALRIACR